ncbi:MAG: flagellar hook-length control protein FliK, partial [Spirochaetia bacterium]|nr:flagellar hook-length control protein FliK [Spirochaetia bacterium]
KNTVNEHDSSTKMEKLSSLKKSKTNVENLIQHGIEKKNGAAQNMQNDGSQSGMEFGHFRKDNGISNMFRLETSSRLEDAKSQQSFNELVEKARMNFGSDGRSSASIRMNPAHFGRMTLNIEMQNNQLQAKLLVESSDAKKMIMDEIENLRQELRNHGIQVESISVKVKEPAQVFSSKEFDENSEFQSENPDGNNSSQYEERNKENSTGIDNLQFLGLEIEQEIENNLVEQSSVGNINISI